MKEIKLITWDLDGTLYPNSTDFSDEINRRKIEKVAKHLNISVQDAEVKFEQIRSKLLSHTKTLDYLGLDGSQFFLKLWEEMPLELFIKKNNRLVQLFDKIEFPHQALLTNSNSIENIKRKLKLIGLNTKYFKYIITSVEVGFNKPNLKIFEELINQSKLRPSEIMYVGDREKVDIIPAKKIGMKTCMVGSKSVDADMSVRSPVELLEMFNR
ncbi:MAG: HAD family hydrolase [Candidatus Pacebacteria bacterium]|nr:HAD family hydrolase [Candidatus Paceibacterota bacterium]